jgi:mlo protein
VTPSTWIVAAACPIIVVISLAAERGLHPLPALIIFLLANAGELRACHWCSCEGMQTLKKNDQRPLYEALLKVKEGKPSKRNHSVTRN